MSCIVYGWEEGRTIHRGYASIKAHLLKKYTNDNNKEKTPTMRKLVHMKADQDESRENSASSKADRYGCMNFLPSLPEGETKETANETFF